jgi:hypothetical protein
VTMQPKGRCTKSVYVSHAVRPWTLRTFHHLSEAALYSLADMTIAKFMYVATSSRPPGAPAIEKTISQRDSLCTRNNLRRPISESCEGIPKPPIVTPLSLKLAGLESEAPGVWCTSGFKRAMVKLISFSDS